ncbi:MAG: isoleucyl-tRNA synthetase [uncultured bacterium]|nr:MAG: isoleucyl-tRNA synthetase [uncultured bacterium]
MWILSLINRLVKEVTKDLDGFDTASTIAKIGKFVDEFSTWYIRRSRDRVGASAVDNRDKNAFYSTTYEVLTTLSKVIAPLAPFAVEEIYKNLTGGESVHLTEWPISKETLINEDLEEEMIGARWLASTILGMRKTAGVKVKIPFRKIIYSGPRELSKSVLEVVKAETNVYELEFLEVKEDWAGGGNLDESNQDVEAGNARDVVRKIQEERKKIGTGLSDKVDVSLPEWPKEFEDEIKRKALINNLSEGEFLVTKS